MDWTGVGNFIDTVGGTVIGIAGTIVAGVAVVLTHRERTSDYRKHLFEKQVQVWE